ncbi:MAG: Ig-like domain-containing protein [Armatimonadota bacterium]
MTRWACILAVLVLACAAWAEDFESGFLYTWQIPGRNVGGTPAAPGATIRLADNRLGEPVHLGRYSLRVEAADKQQTVSPIGRVSLDDSPNKLWLVEGWILVQRGQLFTNSYHFNADGGYVGEKQFFYNATPAWQHFRVVVGPPESKVDVPLSKGGVSFGWPLHAMPNSLVYFDDFSIEPLDLSTVTVQDPGWKRADGKATFKVQVCVKAPDATTVQGIAGRSATWPANIVLPELAGTPRAGVKVMLRPDRQGLETIEPAVATTDDKGVATFTVRAIRAGVVRARAYTPAPPGKPYGELLSAKTATLTWAESDTKVAIEDFTGHNWQNELVQYRLAWPAGAADPATLRVQNEANTVLASQLSEVEKYPDGSIKSALVSWLASLAPYTIVRYSVSALPMNRRSAALPASIPATDLRIVKGADLEIATGKIAVRLPFKPVAVKDPQKDGLPGPILAVRGRSGRWLGRGWLEHPGGAYRITPELRAAGPVFADYHIDYELTNGRYSADVRVIAGSEVALVTEEYDTASGAFKFSLYQGLQPDTARWRGHTSDPYLAPGYNGSFSGEQALSPLKYDKDGQIFGLAGWMTWWPNSGQYWGVYDSRNPQSDYLGIFRCRSGQWRNPTWPGVEMSKKPDLVATFALGAGKRLWGFYSATLPEAEPPIPADFKPGIDVGGGLRIGNAGESGSAATSFSGLNKAMIKYGEMPLNKYKDWVLDWPGAEEDIYPRMFVAPGKLEDVRKRVKDYPPVTERLGRHTSKLLTYLVTGNEKVGREIYDGAQGGDYNWTGQLNRLKSDVVQWLEWEGDTGAAMHNLHGQIKIRMNALRYDSAAAVQSLTPRERRLLRALMAFEAHKAADLDWVPFGTGFHLGNPNMPTAVAATIGLCGAALPSHPYAPEWMDRAYRYVRDTINSFTAPGGAWNECPHYQMDASIQQIVQLAAALKNTGYADLFAEPQFQETMHYAAEIMTPPDPRVGYRVLPSIGNGGLESTSLYGWMAAMTRETNPAFAETQQWMWNEGGELLMYPFDELGIDPNGKATAPKFTSRNFPGFGAILRSGTPDPKETYMAFRAGYMTSHYEPGDQGEMVIYAKGAPLCLDFGSQYAPSVGRQYMHNRISFEHRMSRDNGSITAFTAGDHADYARSQISTTTLYELPETPEEEQKLREQHILLPNTSPPTKTVPRTEWYRQVVFVKDADPAAPNYFLVRDSFNDGATLPTDWNLWTLSTGVKWEGNHAIATAQYGNVLLDVFMLSPAQPAWETGEWGHKFLPGQSGSGWAKQNKGKPFEERQKLLRVKQGPGGGYLAVLYPRDAAEAAPRVTALPNDNGAKITHAQGTDLVFALTKPGESRVENVLFSGISGVISQRKDSFILTLALLDGTKLALEGKLGLAQQKSEGMLALTIAGKELTLESDGKARQVEIMPPASWLTAQLPADSPYKIIERKETSWVVTVPTGKTKLTISK